MILALRIVLGLAIVLISAALSLVAFAKAIDSPHATYDGLILGFSSAIIWALSTLGSRNVTGVLNIFAALFAACRSGTAFISSPDRKVFPVKTGAPSLPFFGLTVRCSPYRLVLLSPSI